MYDPVGPRTIAQLNKVPRSGLCKPNSEMGHAFMFREALIPNSSLHFYSENNLVHSQTRFRPSSWIEIGQLLKPTDEDGLFYADRTASLQPTRICQGDGCISEPDKSSTKHT